MDIFFISHSALQGLFCISIFFVWLEKFAVKRECVKKYCKYSGLYYNSRLFMRDVQARNTKYAV